MMHFPQKIVSRIADENSFRGNPAAHLEQIGWDELTNPNLGKEEIKPFMVNRFASPPPPAPFAPVPYQRDQFRPRWR
jgi:hypothetical protein